jgi:hypothetical protein
MAEILIKNRACESMVMGLLLLKGVIICLWVCVFHDHEKLTYFTPQCMLRALMVDLVGELQCLG